MSLFDVGHSCGVINRGDAKTSDVPNPNFSRDKPLGAKDDYGVKALQAICNSTKAF